MAANFRGKQLLDPVAVARQCTSKYLPTDWIGLANKYTCTRGIDPGIGNILLTRKDLDSLDLNQEHYLEFDDGKNKIRLKSLHVAGPTRCLTPGYPDDPSAVHLVTIADPRRMFKLATANLGFNLSVTPTGNYSTFTAPASTTPTTWKQMWEYLWNRLPTTYAGSPPALPSTPDGSPDSFPYYGKSAADALKDMLARLAMDLIYDPFTDKFSVVSLGQTQSNLENSEKSHLNRRLYDREPVSSSFGRVPATLEVYFPKDPPAAYGQSPYYVVSVNAPAPSNTAIEKGTLRIFDDMQAMYQSQTLTNGSELGQRASARATEFFRQRRDAAKSQRHKIYSGVLKDFLPGSQISAVAWADVGTGWNKGLITEVMRPEEDDPVEAWAGTGDLEFRLVEFVRVRGAVGSGSPAAPAGYQPGTVTLFNTITDDWDGQFSCWWREANGGAGEPGFRYLSRWVGHKNNKPVYIGSCCPPAGSGSGGPAVGGSGDGDDPWNENDNDSTNNSGSGPTPSGTPGTTGSGGCCTGTAPNSFTIRFANAMGSCGCLNDFTATVTNSGPPTAPQWTGNGTSVCNGGTTLQVRVSCQAVAGTQVFQINVAGIVVISAPASAVTCSPFLVFWDNATVGGFCSGTVDITGA